MALAQRLASLLTALLGTQNFPQAATQLGWTTLRVVAGILMIHNGLDKLADIEGFAEAYVEVIGLPFPLFFSYLAAYTELIGAPLLALGFLGRPAAFALFGTMTVAMYHHILVAGFSIPYLELSGLYAATFLFFTINGPGAISIDNLILQLVQVRGREQQIETLKASYEATEKISQVAQEDLTSAR